MRERFTFFKSYGDSLQSLPDEERLRVYDAIYRYSIYDEEPEIDGIAKAFFDLMKPVLDKSNSIIDKGKKGGRPKTEKPNQNLNKTKTKPNDNLTETKSKPIQNLNETEVGEEVGVGEEVEVEDGVEVGEEEGNQTLSFSTENDCRAEAQRVIAEWNTLEALGVAPVNTISRDSRRYKMLCSRIREHGEEKVIDAIYRIRGSDFLLGRKTDFTITFDWFVKPNNFAKVADGNYTNNSRSGTTAEENRQAFWDKWRDV